MAIVFYIILAYLLYLFIFNFLIPVIRTTRQVRRSFRQMKEHMNGAMGGYDNRPAEKPQPTRVPKKGDYIDFEEIKE